MFNYAMMAAAVLLSLCAQAQRYAVYGTVRDSKNQESIVGATLQHFLLVELQLPLLVLRTVHQQGGQVFAVFATFGDEIA